MLVVPEIVPSALELGFLLPDWSRGTSREARCGSGTISSRDLPSARLLYLFFVRLCAWLALLPRSDNVKNTEIMVVRHQIAVLHSQVRTHWLTWADRAVLAALPSASIDPVPNAKRAGWMLSCSARPRYSSRMGARVGETHTTRVTLLVQSDCHNHLCGVRAGEGTRALFSAYPCGL